LQQIVAADAALAVTGLPEILGELADRGDAVMPARGAPKRTSIKAEWRAGR